MGRPITIGDVTIEPGHRGSVDLHLGDLFNQAPMTMPIRVINGRRDGPTLFVCAALHGDEINGVEIIRRVLSLSSLKRLRGTLIAVPVVNVFGFVNNSRYLPDRRDLNRSFPGSPQGSLAARLARLFMNEIVSKCDWGIDLHTGAVHRDNFPQVRANLDDPEVTRLATAFGIPVAINADFREGSLRHAGVSQGVRILVYEAGEALRFDEFSIRAGVKGVTRVMRALDMLPASKGQPRIPKTIVARSSKWVRAPQSGVIRTPSILGRQVHKGDELGIISDLAGDREIPLTCPVDGIVIGRGYLPVVHEGDALFHIVQVEGTKVAARALDAFEPEEAYELGLTSELADEPTVS